MNKRKIFNVELEDKYFYLILATSLIVLFLITVYLSEDFGAKKFLTKINLDDTLLLIITPVILVSGIVFLMYPYEFISILKKVFLIALLTGISIYFYSFGFESFDRDLKLFIVTFCIVVLVPLIIKN